MTGWKKWIRNVVDSDLKQMSESNALTQRHGYLVRK